MGKQSGPEVTQYEYYQTVACVICLGELKRVRRVWFDNDVVYDDRPEQAGWSGRPATADGRRPSLASYLKSDNIEVYLGTQTQGASPTLEALIGTADCPAYRGRAMVVWKDLPIHKFGGRMPSMSFEVESAGADADGKADLVDVINDVMDMAGNPDNGIPGVPSANRDLTQLAGIKVDGFLLMQRAEARQHLTALQEAFMFDFVDVDYKITAIKRGGSAVGTIDAQHLGTGTPDPQPQNFELTRGQQIETPQRVDVTYQSAAIDFQTFTQSTTREATLVRRSETINLPVVMGETNAMAIARQQLAMKQLQRDGMRVFLPMRYIAWAPGDLVNMPMPSGLTQLFKIVKQVIGLFGHIEMTMVPDDPDIYTLSGDGAAPPAGGGTGVVEAYAPILWAADLPALVNSADASFDGCSLITVVSSARVPWQGAKVKCEEGIRNTGGTLKNNITENLTKGTIGYLTATLGKWRGPNVWDDTNTITVKLADVFVAYAQPAGGNTGNGVIEMRDPSTSGGVMAGTYLVQFTSSTAFTVKDPLGATVGTGSVGTVFYTEVRFKITSGSTAFVAGDEFDIIVSVANVLAGNAPVGLTDLEVLDGANVMVVGGEVLQFVSAVDLGNNTYQLTRLLRGRRGTEYLAWDDHPSGTAVAFLDVNSAQRFKAKLSEAGNTHTLSPWDIGKTNNYNSVPTIDVELAGNCRKPWGPGAVQLERAGSDLVVDWEYRSRWGDELDDGGTGTVQLGETTELYDIEVWDSTFTTLKRTVSGHTVSNWTYTAADQATDFGAAPQNPLGLILYQVSPLVGRGFPTRVVVTI